MPYLTGSQMYTLINISIQASDECVNMFNAHQWKCTSSCINGSSGYISLPCCHGFMRSSAMEMNRKVPRAPSLPQLQRFVRKL